ncbi:MucR family transcriptional regulator [Mesorhizobium sp.]|uniref:MucR family transcriptional regulator n=1 Tax=Mesorhizobium sp. TaxID=1871066 RepID=UPI000FEA58E3|nr:MucR family transcriptional regulator [Mesorhizobium sp.]RWC26353.1 MAG: transcriptional regulator [Mesorhizobium sp.]TIX20783.1 MAG: transcriptional regulator [Mesorhizobium sp.]
MIDQHNQAAELAELTADVVSAYVSNNPVPVGSLPELIASVHASLQGLGSPVAPPAERNQPAVNPKRSVTPNFIYCIEDGKKFRSLRRHLMSEHGMTPEAYRAKWDLPGGYPMTAPKYSEKRSELAKAAGLGQRPAPQEKASTKRKQK